MLHSAYNSYLIIGQEKIALIDSVDPEKVPVLLNNLGEAGVRRIDYLVSLHTEQDHGGGARAILLKYPMAQIIANAKVRELMITHLHVPDEKITVIGEGDRLELGGKTLRFMMIPFAHWPDNYMAHLEEDNILFSSDLFGSHYSTGKAFSTSSADQRFAAKTYYAEIMMPFRTQIAGYTARVRELAPRLIAPAHGPVWYDPNLILYSYARWAGDGVKRLVSIPYVSMHNSTRVMVERLAVRLSEQGLSVICRDLGSEVNSLTVGTSEFITDLVYAAAVIMATPTVLGGPHPNIAYAALVANALRPKARFLGVMGSYGWGTKVAETIDSLTANLKMERLKPLLVKGLPTDEDLARVDQMAFEIGEKIRNIPDLIR
jgi:flavorubredoxin